MSRLSRYLRNGALSLLIMPYIAGSIKHPELESFSDTEIKKVSVPSDQVMADRFNSSLDELIRKEKLRALGFGMNSDEGQDDIIDYYDSMAHKVNGMIAPSDLISMIDDGNYDIPSFASMDWLLAKVDIESKFKKFARSRMGAQGLMQITPIAAKEINMYDEFKKYSFRPENNLKFGFAYIRRLDDFMWKYNPDWPHLDDSQKRPLTSAAFNGGPSKLMSVGWDISRMPPETRRYVDSMDAKERQYALALSSLRRFRELAFNRNPNGVYHNFYK